MRYKDNITVEISEKIREMLLEAKEKCLAALKGEEKFRRYLRFIKFYSETKLSSCWFYNGRNSRFSWL